ncbi:MAG: aminoacyl--tRNA ligase-related protein [Candidatus Nasuia deltocephalinicola]
MFNKNFIIKNLKKISINLKKKKYFLNKKILFFFIKLKKIFENKKIFINKLKKTFKIVFYKKYILKIKYILNSYIKKINKNLKLIIFKMPNIIHYIIPKKNKIIVKKKYKNSNIKLKYFKKKFFNLNIANKCSGKGFSFICGGLSILYKELEEYILDLHIKENNFKYIKVPNIMKFKSLLNSCQIPKFIKKLFIIKNKKKIKYLIPTSEVSILNFMFSKTLNSNYIPIKLVSKTECYRNENISYGKINKNIIRQKQFDKIELFYYVDNKNSYKYLKELVKNVEKIIRNFKINYRIIMLSNKEINYNSTITYDIEVWLPSINDYCEVSSCSNMETHQTLRASIKYLNCFKKEYLNTINGSGVALGRLFLSILEKSIKIDDKKVKIPNLLKNISKFKFINFN